MKFGERRVRRFKTNTIWWTRGERMVSFKLWRSWSFWSSENGPIKSVNRKRPTEELIKRRTFSFKIRSKGAHTNWQRRIGVDAKNKRIEKWVSVGFSRWVSVCRFQSLGFNLKLNGSNGSECSCLWSHLDRPEILRTELHSIEYSRIESLDNALVVPLVPVHRSDSRKGLQKELLGSTFSGQTIVAALAALQFERSRDRSKFSINW